jgi:hypothetical protein
MRTAILWIDSVCIWKPASGDEIAHRSGGYIQYRCYLIDQVVGFLNHLYHPSEREKTESV